MSGGSYGYAFMKVEDVADEIERRLADGELDDPSGDLYLRVWCPERRCYLPPEEGAAVLAAAPAERRWLAELLRRVARAMHAVEWVDSGDRSPGGEVETIRALRRWAAGTPGGEDANGR